MKRRWCALDVGVGEDDNVTTLVKVEKKEEMRRISSVAVLCVVWESV